MLLRIAAVLFLGTTLSHAASLDEKISQLDHQIREMENKRDHNPNELKRLVDKYNQLIHQKETGSSVEQGSTNQHSTSDNNILEQLKDHERRLEEIEKRLKIDRSEAKTLRQEQEDKAMKLAEEKAPSLNVSSPAFAQYNQAMSLFSKNTENDTRNAAEAFEYIIQEYPDDEFAFKSYIKAGEAYQKLKNYDLAEQRYTKGLTFKLDDYHKVLARIKLAEVLSEKGKTQEACEQLNQLKNEKFEKDLKTEYDNISKKLKCPVKKN